MRKFNELSLDERKKAVEVRLQEIANMILYDVILLEDDLQDRIEEIRKEAEDLSTPWFALEMLFEDEKLSKVIRELAEDDMKEAFFPNHNDIIIHLV